MAEETRIHPESGAVLKRGIRQRTLYRGPHRITFDQPGWWPDDNSDGVLVGADNQVWSDAVAELDRIEKAFGADAHAK